MSIRPGSGSGRKHICSTHGFLNAADQIVFVRDLAHLPFFSVSLLELRAAFVERALGIHENQVARLRAIGHIERADADVGCARSDQRNLDVLNPLADDFQGVDQAGQANGCRPLLVVMPDRDLAAPAQLGENVETLGLRDILEVYPAKRRLKNFYRPDDFIGILGIEADRERIHAAEIFKKNAFSFHDRQAGLGSDIAQAQDAGAVRDYGHRIPLVGMLKYFFGIFEYVFADFRYSRCIPNSKVIKVANAAFRRSLQLSREKRMQFHCIFRGLVGLSQQLLLGHSFRLWCLI